MLRVLADRAVAVGVIAAGLLVLLIGWVGISGRAYPAEQLPYLLSGGLFGVALIGIGATVWLSADAHDEWRKLDKVEHLLQELTAMGLGPKEPIEVEERTPSSNGSTPPRPRASAAASES